jgi:hypothetical protein
LRPAFFADALDAAALLADPEADGAVPLFGVTGVTGVMIAPVAAVGLLVPPPAPEDAPSVPDGATGADVVADGFAPRLSSPSQRGFRQMITAMPHAVTSRSIAMNARSFCFADGPRGRTTTVAVLPRRGFTGRSGMRIVIW